MASLYQQFHVFLGVEPEGKNFANVVKALRGLSDEESEEVVARLWDGFRALTRRVAAMRLLVWVKSNTEHCLLRRLYMWRNTHWDPSVTGFDIVKIQTPHGDHRAMSLSGSSLAFSPHPVPPQEKRRSVEPQVHLRLYEEAKKKRGMTAMYEEARRYGDLKECTFTPKAAQRHSASSPTVHERLYQSLKSEKAKEQQNLKKRMNKEMSECTFSPRVSAPSAKATAPSFTRLYEDAEKRQSSVRAKGESADVSTPKTFSASQVAKGDSLIYDKLFNESRILAVKLRKQQLLKSTQENEGVTFSPRINPRKAASSAAPAFQRLYDLGEAAQRKMQEKRREQSPVTGKVGTKEEEPRHEKLYQRGMEKPVRQAELQAKIDQERGISFTPKTNSRSCKLSPR